MKLFIDTNIYLDYFRAGKEGLASLEALKTLLEQKKLSLIVPAQTKEEYIRNRATIVETTRKVLIAKQKLLTESLPSAPTIKDWDETKRVREETDKIKEPFKKLVEKYDEETEEENTASDKLIAEIFKLGELIDEDEKLLAKAYSRYLKGHPPRKSDNSYGDAIVWETLLKKATNDDLTVITHDTDFIEERRGKEELQTYLKKEWSEKTQRHKIGLYKSLGEFINTFENKETVKKDIIEKEKETSVYPVSSVLSGISAGDFLDTASTRINSLSLTGRYSVLARSPWGLASKVRFCPYCGTEISRPDRITLSAMYPDEKNYTCHDCGKSFEIKDE